MKQPAIYQFKITLRHIRPPIWRRFQVYDTLTFYQLHEVVQKVMDWGNYHLHLFDFNGWQITDAETLADGWGDGEDEQKAKLKNFFEAEGQKCRYEYDFGDDWQHDLLLEKILPAEPGVSYPRCLKGKRACPPEDCGGVWGYAEILEALADPDHPDRDHYLELTGDDFDPEAFDLDAINAALQNSRL
jgi:hypothetical protein